MILKHFQQPVFNNAAEMILKFNLKECNSQNFPAIRMVYSY